MTYAYIDNQNIYYFNSFDDLKQGVFTDIKNHLEQFFKERLFRVTITFEDFIKERIAILKNSTCINLIHDFKVVFPASYLTL